MAKEHITYSCGHTETANLIGNAQSRKYRAKKMAEGVCSKCEQAERAAENEKAAAANAASGLVALDGTPKQVAWAEAIRKDAIAAFEALAPIYDLRAEFNATEDQDARQEVNRRARRAMEALPYRMSLAFQALQSRELYLILMDELRRSAGASWWIDNHAGGDQIVAALLPELRKIERERARQAAEAATEAKEALEEALIAPVGERKPLVAEIGRPGNTIELRYGERDQALVAVAKGLGYAWDGTHWALPITTTSGDPLDRMAELAQRLAAAGFAVRMHDAEARNRAISGNFSPACPRWIRAITEGEHAGWYLITWGREDDLYSAARSVPGSRYVKKQVIAPASTAEAILDFAGRYDFRISQAAQGIIDAQLAALAAGQTVGRMVERPAAVAAGDVSKPGKLTPPTDAGIDADLSDV